MSRPVGFYAHSGQLTILPNAHTATDGFFWILNNSADKLCIRRIVFQSAPTAITVFASAPRITLERMTFTGSPSGTVLPLAARTTYDVLSSGVSARTAVTGIVPVAGATFMNFIVPPVLTAIGAPMTTLLGWKAKDDEVLVLAPREGIVVRQAVAGSILDTRRLTVDIACDVAWDSLF